MKPENGLCNNLKSIRTRLGMSQQDLANLAGVTRQTISGVESGQYAPSVAITLRIAKALGCRVEDLFWLEQELPIVEAQAAQSFPYDQQMRVSLARVGGQWIAYPLIGDHAFRMEMIPADGKGIRACVPSEHHQTGKDKVQVRLLNDLEKLHHTVVLAGCAPVLSLWARATERWHPELRVHWNFANSMAALHSLSRGEIHMAGTHLYDPKTGEHNIPFVRDALKGKASVLIAFGVWEEGLLVASGNPMGLRTVADLAQTGVSVVNREVGSGSRLLLERKLQDEKVPFHEVKGFDHIVYTHQDVAQAIATGIADAGISTASIAATFGLGFIPLHQSRYDLAILKQYLEETPVQQLLSTLGHQRVHSQLEVLGGFDTSKTGEVVATFEG